MSLKETFEGKKVLVTGGTGSIGSEIVRQLLKYNPSQVRIFSRDDTKQAQLMEELKGHKNLRFLLGDVRDFYRLKMAMEDIDIVFHAAALKHVHLCEYNPFEAVNTNIIGTQNVIHAAMEREVEKFLMISTDKAVNSVSTMGASKLLAERLTTSANLYKGSKRSIFSCVRFGNVIDSRGSVYSLFKRQIEAGGPVTITDMEMTRFFMSTAEAVNLVLKSVELMKGGETFVLKMPAFRMSDLAEVMIEELAEKHGHQPEKIKIQEVGIRHGEKMHEELIALNENFEINEKDGFFVLTNNPVYNKNAVRFISNEGLMSKDDLKNFLQERNLL